MSARELSSCSINFKSNNEKFLLTTLVEEKLTILVRSARTYKYDYKWVSNLKLI